MRPIEARTASNHPQKGRLRRWLRARHLRVVDPFALASPRIPRQIDISALGMLLVAISLLGLTVGIALTTFPTSVKVLSVSALVLLVGLVLFGLALLINARG